jgi:uncharacterized repeat protein (TIGR01451 family)
VVATLQLQDERPGVTNMLSPVTITFNPPVATHMVATNGIIIPDHGAGMPYPSSVTVSGLNGVVVKAVVTLKGLSHSFPRDINALLVSPSGDKVLLMSHTGAGYSTTNITLTFDDSAVTNLPSSGLLVSGTNRPSSYPGAAVFPPPAPAGPYGSAMAAVNGGNPNGTWSLYIFDDAVGDAGNIAGGWTLDLATATTLRPVADLALSMTTTPSSLYVGAVITNTIWVTNYGPASATGVVVSNYLSTGEHIVSNIGNLAANASAQVTLVLAPTLAGNIVNTATVGGNEADLNPVNNAFQNTVGVTAPAIAVLDGAIQGGQFHLSVTAEAGFQYVILSSSNLLSWTPISTNTASPGGVIKFTDTGSSGLSTRYYRTKRVLP